MLAYDQAGADRGNVLKTSKELASFDADLTSALTPAKLGSHHAMLFNPNAGGLAGQTYLVVDINGVAGYQAGHDLVLHLDAATNTASLATTDFI